MSELLLVRVRDAGLCLKAENLPEVGILSALVHDDEVAVCALILREQTNVSARSGKVGFSVGRVHLVSDPDESCMLCLNNRHAARVESKKLLAALESILGEQSAHDALGVVFLVAHYQEDARTDFE